MRYEIESEGGRIHWIVKCIHREKLVELHRFLRLPEGFVYHRGKHGEQELPAQEALLEYFEQHPELLIHSSSPAETPRAT